MNDASQSAPAVKVGADNTGDIHDAIDLHRKRVVRAIKEDGEASRTTLSEAMDLQRKRIVGAVKTQGETDTSLIIKAIEAQTRTIVAALEKQTSAIVFQSLPEKIMEFVYESQPVRLYLPIGDYDYVQNAIFRKRTFYEEPILRLVRERFNLSGKSVLNRPGFAGDPNS